MLYCDYQRRCEPSSYSVWAKTLSAYCRPGRASASCAWQSFRPPAWRGPSAADQSLPFHFGDANGWIRRNLPIERIEPPDGCRSDIAIKSITTNSRNRPLEESGLSHFSISDVLFRENTIWNRFRESQACHPHA